MKSIAAVLIGLLTTFPAASAWKTAFDGDSCTVSKTSDNQQIYFYFDDDQGQARLALSSARLKPFCSSIDSKELVATFGSDSLDLKDSAISCGTGWSTLPTALLWIGDLGANPALKLANASTVKLTLPGTQYSELFNFAGSKQALGWMRQCLLEHPPTTPSPF